MPGNENIICCSEKLASFSIIILTQLISFYTSNLVDILWSWFLLFSALESNTKNGGGFFHYKN